ncbi:MAG: hypothetical protein WCH58_01710 [Candidatus Saccharibacteria bacterium]
MKQFIFKSYDFDKVNSLAKFEYGFNDGRTFIETVTFEVGERYDDQLLDKALFLAFMLIGTSYYKTFPLATVRLGYKLDNLQVDFFNTVYQEGLGQFAFENNLTRDDLAHFTATGPMPTGGVKYNGSGILALQSGGKDSLLTAELLKKSGKEFTSWYISSSDNYPKVLDKIGAKLALSRRNIDHDGLRKAEADGGLKGHVPVTYIVQSLAIIQAILLNKNEVITSIAHEGEEPHAFIGDLAVNHQWSKTWMAEMMFAKYVSIYISPDLHIGSLIRGLSELRVAELFVKNVWPDYGHDFSSCNLANYKQGNDNSVLKWCGNCPKCANSYLLFAPFLEAVDLKSLFDGQDLFVKPDLVNTFKGLLEIDGVMKPFECVGEVDELRLAYHMAQKKGGYAQLPFDVPESTFDYLKTYQSQVSL